MTNINKTRQEVYHENVTSIACKLTTLFWFSDNTNQKEGTKPLIFPACFVSTAIRHKYAKTC